MATAQRPALKRIGAAWKGKQGSKALLTGSITVAGKKQRWMLFKNDHKPDGSKEPDYVILSGQEPEVDDFAQPSQDAPARSALVNELPDDVVDVPF
jgi:hypothetical protein